MRVPKAIEVTHCKVTVYAQTFLHPDQPSCPLHSLYFQVSGIMVFGGLLLLCLVLFVQSSSRNGCSFTYNQTTEVSPEVLWGGGKGRKILLKRVVSRRDFLFLALCPEAGRVIQCLSPTSLHILLASLLLKLSVPVFPRYIFPGPQSP